MTRLDKKYRAAILKIANVMGANPCSMKDCPGCETEMQSAVDVAKKAFRLRTPRKVKA